MEQIDPAVLRVFCCPETRQALRLASPSILAKLESMRVAGRLRNRSGALVETPIGSALCRVDGRRCYPIFDGIPHLLVEEGIPIDPAS